MPQQDNPSVVVIDYGAGNLGSVQKAIRHLGFECKLVTAAEELSGASLVVFPGVGSAGYAMRFLTETSLDSAIRQHIDQGGAFLGICLGMQVLFKRSEEDGTACLGIFDGDVKRLPPSPGVKVPHIGWNQVDTVREDRLFDGIESRENFYFVHSYYADCVDESDVRAVTSHGVAFPSVVRRNRVVGVQFHPEKSSTSGLKLLRNILKQTGVG
jgi:glutamine amidotransferase